MSGTSRTSTPQKTKPYKAIGAGGLSGLIAFGSSLVTALQGQNASFGTVTDGQWVAAAVAALIAVAATGGVTYAVRNPPA
jgi:hypothetical protein